MMRCVALFGLLALLASNVSAQGLRSPRTKMRQINTDTARIIFTPEMEQTAQRVSNVIHTMAREHGFTSSEKLRKISIILQDETDIPNGYVGLAPWRSEFYLSPPPNNFELGSLPWADLLAIHEYRHVQQNSIARTGLSSVAYHLMGEDFFNAIVNISWPDWYREGDAVISETALTAQGRGRLPSFLNPYREKIMEGESWKYMKARNGSFKEFVPNHYNLGFLMQNYGRQAYGQSFWDTVALESAAYAGLIYPFSKAIERVSGLNSREFYTETMNFHREAWQLPESSRSLQSVTAERDDYQDFSNPVFTEAGELLVVVESFDEIPAIYRVESDGQLYQIVDMGFGLDNAFSYSNGKLAWAELRIDSRWERVDYSSLVVYDMQKKQRNQITRKSSYFAPALAPNGNVLATMHSTDSGYYSIHVLSSRDGRVLRELPNPANYYLSYPTWTQDGANVVMSIRDSIGQMAVALQHVESGDLRVLTDWTMSPVGRPSVAGDMVYFTRSEQLTDQIYRVSISVGRTERMTDGVHSNYQPVIDPTNGDLIFAEYSLDGKRLRRMPAGSLQPLDVQHGSSDYLSLEPGEKNILGAEYPRKYQTRKYSNLAHPINIHSWRPVFDDPVYGIEIQSENVLQSIRWNTGFQFQRNESAFGPYTNIVLATWYPQIVFGYNGRSFKDVEDGIKFFRHTFNGGLSIPFRGLYGAYSYFGYLSSSINRSKWVGDLEFSLDFLRHRFHIVNRRRQAVQHPLTRFGQALEVVIGDGIDTIPATQLLVKTDFTFPSPLRNQVLWLQFDYKRNLDFADFTFTDEFDYSRGYNSVPSDWIYRLGVNYQLPLFYPDWGFGGLVYFKRVIANLFADFSTYKLAGEQLNQNGVGAELIFDVEFLNVEPFTFGLRGTYLIDESALKFGVFIPVERI